MINEWLLGERNQSLPGEALTLAVQTPEYMYIQANINILIKLHIRVHMFMHKHISYIHVTRIIKEDIVNLEGGTGWKWKERWSDIDGWRCSTHMKF